MAGDGPSSSNPFGTIGLAPGARILSLRVAERAPEIALEHDEARAIRYAASHGARVIYVDVTVSDDDSVLDSAVHYAQSKGAVLVASTLTYRSSLRQDWYPASLPGVLGAGSVILPGLPSAASRYPTSRNDSILVAAPGNKLTVTGPAGPGYAVWGGPAAAVWLTATAALVKSVFPHLPPGLVARAIAVSARDRPRGGYNTRRGFGLINPAGALHAAARLARLHLAARSGTPRAAYPSAHLAAGPGPGPIRAVHHSAGRVAGFAGTVAAGAVLLAFAAVMARRWRRASSRG
ncbi:MAG: S8 family serine peptidase [Actinobacteria bacterium]|nr:S8 family serine peptidase [Actinomycetota bacterium]